MASIGNERIKKTIEGYTSKREERVQRLESNEGPYGAKRLPSSAEPFWFERKAAQDPDWVRALPHVQGGKEVLRNYVRQRWGR
jgi:hypothetical protein